jgi:hypothetical protein
LSAKSYVGATTQPIERYFGAIAAASPSMAAQSVFPHLTPQATIRLEAFEHPLSCLTPN